MAKHFFFFFEYQNIPVCKTPDSFLSPILMDEKLPLRRKFALQILCEYSVKSRFSIFIKSKTNQSSDIPRDQIARALLSINLVLGKRMARSDGILKCKG